MGVASFNSPGYQKRNRKMRCSGMLLPFLVTLALVSQARTLENESARDKRVLSLFSVVTFKNNECTASNGLTGTCYSSTDCSDLGGTTSGNCASGFGVCCIIEIAACGGTVSQNSTYVSNSGYPSTISSTAQTCTYTVNYCSTNICQLRLDFTNLVLETTNGAVTTDYLTVNGPTDVDPPAIAGTNTGYHMYVETARSTTATTVAVTTASATSTAQSWRIRVSQIDCESTMLAPESCTQYFTTDSGTIYSYGYPEELQSQRMTACIRANANKCSVDYSAAGGTSPDTFEVGSAIATSENTACATSVVLINNANVGTGSSGTGPAGATGAVCNSVFAAIQGTAADGVIKQTSAPFFITHLSETSSLSGFEGFKLNYVQNGGC